MEIALAALDSVLQTQPPPTKACLFNSNPFSSLLFSSLFAMFVLHHLSPHSLRFDLVGAETRRLSCSFAPFSASGASFRSFSGPKTLSCISRASKREDSKTQKLFDEVEVVDDDEGFDELDEFAGLKNFRERQEEEIDYDRDPEFAEILGHCLDEPDKAQSKMEERLKKKRSKILHTKTGSAMPMEVTLNQFDFSNSYIWFQFYNTPLQKDISLISDVIRSWHIIGRLGGCNSMNMQLSQSPVEKRPVYDATQGANVTPTTFYNIGDLEVQDNLARIWLDIGTSEPLLLDVLINALTQISTDYVGIKHLVFGGSEFENWNEELKSEDTGYSTHKI